MSSKEGDAPQFDTGDIDRWVGIPLGGSNMKDPVHVNDIRRWAKAMQNPNPLYYDEKYAADSRFGRIVAPQSFTPACSDSGGGVAPAIQGRIPGTHLLFAGDEYWFYGPRIFPGDKIRQDRMLYDYKVTETGFAGPSMFTRGDTTYINNRGEIIAKQRASAIRYNVESALARGQYEQEDEPEWTRETLHQYEREKDLWIMGFRELGHGRRLSVEKGEKLPRRPIGPHSVESMILEWFATLAMPYGAFEPEGLGWESTEGESWDKEAGWLPELARDAEGAKLDPARGDPVLYGPAKGHQSEGLAAKVGMPRGYGFGAMMTGWMIDYVANWVGEWGELVYCKSTLRAPTLTGDMAFLDGEVSAILEDHPRGLGRPLALVQVTMTDQNEKVLATFKTEVRLPTEAMPAPIA